jgi:hypothetical protein
MRITLMFLENYMHTYSPRPFVHAINLLFGIIKNPVDDVQNSDNRFDRKSIVNIIIIILLLLPSWPLTI